MRNKNNKKNKHYKVEPKSKKTCNSTTQKEGKIKKTRKKHKILKRIILTFLALCFIIGIIGIGIIVGIFSSDKYKVTEEQLNPEYHNTKLLNKNEEQTAELSGEENRKVITLDEMNPYLPQAFVAIEDERFYEHSGIDIKRTLGATVKFILHKGNSSFGGSTITQQLVKNCFKDSDDEGVKGVERKIREMARARNVEKIWSKQQILEAYLNRIYMGGYSKNIMGVEMGAEYYFNKTAKDLTLAECAFLAGINNTPNSYAPFNEEKDNSELIRTRTIDVLWKMKELGYITSEEEYNSAIQEVEDGLKFEQSSNIKSTYSYFAAATIQQVINQLVEEKGWDKEDAMSRLAGSGYTIYTTEDSSIQAKMEEEFVKDKYIVKGTKKDKDGNLINKGHTQAGMVIMDHTTGQVVGCMGGLGTDVNALGLNRATQGAKQPGSSIKPIAVTAPALEKGIITAGTVYDDSATDFGGGYTPHNSDGYDGLMTIRKALARSSNIVHVKIMKELEPSNSMAFLKTLGIDVPSSYEDLSLALGTPAVTPLEMAAAYAAIANNGEYIEPTFFTKVVDLEGNVVIEAKQEKRRVMSAANAYVLQNLLTSPARSGTAAVCYMSYMDVGAKTGSTNGYKDRWLCGFTPYYTAATWYGFDTSETPNVSGNNAAKIWAAIMKPLHKNLDTKRFTRPSNVVYVKICNDSGCVATESCTNTSSEVFVAGTIPGACEGHQKLTICEKTGKIANEYCTDTEEHTYLSRPEKENTTLWKTEEGDKYDIPTEVCDVHKKPEIEQVVMIDVTGNTIKNAKSKLEDLGLKVEIKYSEDKDKYDTIVLKQSVVEGEKVDKGTTITLTVNKKQEEAPSPEPDPDTNTEGENKEVQGG